MAASRIVPLVLAGGTGTRLWPVSRDAMPKQFLPLVGEKSTYQQALMRVSSPDLFAPPIVMTSDAFRFFARHQAEELGIDATVVLEPIRRDSGPAIAAVHVILDADLFADACRAGRDAAAEGHIVTFGIRPTAPKTSYGYVRRGEALGFEGVSRVAAFVEKPDAATAATYVAQAYMGNFGSFLFRVHDV